MTQSERLVAVEVEVKALKQSFEDHKVETNKKFEEINDKLDSLLALRYKGAGAFWLMTTLFGTTVIGFMSQIFHWFGGK